MKKGGFIVIVLLCLYNTNCFAYSEPETWNNKKSKSIELATNFIVNRESFSSKCYLDGHSIGGKEKYSLGYGTATAVNKSNWCDTHIKRLRYENTLYRYLPDSILRKKVIVSSAQARWKVKEFVIVIYDNLEKVNPILIEKLDEIQIMSLISFIYTIGETLFYKSTLYKKNLSYFIINDKIQCLSIRNEFLKYSLVRTKKGFIKSKGAYKRREIEMLFFTYKNCVF